MFLLSFYFCWQLVSSGCYWLKQCDVFYISKLPRLSFKETSSSLTTSLLTGTAAENRRGVLISIVLLTVFTHAKLWERTAIKTNWLRNIQIFYLSESTITTLQKYLSTEKYWMNVILIWRVAVKASRLIEQCWQQCGARLIVLTNQRISFISWSVLIYCSFIRKTTCRAEQSELTSSH